MPATKRIWKWSAAQQAVVEVTPVDFTVIDAPFVQDDSIPPTVSHATDEGLVFESRSALYAHYRAHGYECTGGAHHTGKGVADHRHKADIEDVRADVAESLRRLKWGMEPITEREREVCQREERQYQDYVRRQSR